MPLIEEIVADSCCSLEENRQTSVSGPRNAEKLEIQSEGVDLCFVLKHGVEAESVGLISDTLESSCTNGVMHISGKQPSFQHRSSMPVIEEIESYEVSDSCNELLAYDIETGLSMSYSVSVDETVNSKEEESSGSSLICKFCAEI